MRAIKRLLMAFLAITVVSCGSNSDDLKMKYRQQCSGDRTLRCRTMAMDAYIAKLNDQVEALKNRKDEIIKCLGEEKFNEVVKLGKEEISYFEDLRPSLFARIFFSGAEVEFVTPPPFIHNREANELRTLLSTCN